MKPAKKVNLKIKDKKKEAFPHFSVIFKLHVCACVL